MQVHLLFCRGRGFFLWLWKHLHGSITLLFHAAGSLCTGGWWEQQKDILQKADAGSWQDVGRIKAIPAHCKWRKGNVPIANTAFPEKRLQNTVVKGHTSGVGLSS